MQKNEVVEMLEFMRDMCEYVDVIHDDEVPHLTIQQEKESEALTEAIRCVELLPELVNALDEATLKLNDIPHGNFYKEEVQKYEKLLKKVKMV